MNGKEMRARAMVLSLTSPLAPASSHSQSCCLPSLLSQSRIAVSQSRCRSANLSHTLAPKMKLAKQLCSYIDGTSDEKRGWRLRNQSRAVRNLTTDELLLRGVCDLYPESALGNALMPGIQPAF